MAYRADGSWYSGTEEWNTAPTFNLGQFQPVEGFANFYRDSGTGKYFIPGTQHSSGDYRPAGVGSPAGTPLAMTGGQALWGPWSRANVTGLREDVLNYNEAESPSGQVNRGYLFDTDPRGQFVEASTPDDPFWSGMVQSFLEGPAIPLGGFLGAGLAGGALAGAGVGAADAAAAAGAMGGAAGAAGGGLTAAEAAGGAWAAGAGGTAAGSTGAGGGMDWSWLDNIIGGDTSGLWEAENLATASSVANPSLGAPVDWTQIDKMISDLGTNAWEAENLGTTTNASGQLLRQVATEAAKKLGTEGAKSLISKLLGGSATADDYAKLIGAVGPAALGAFGANKQSGDLKALAEQYMGFGAPSRGRYEASMSPGFDPNSIPGYAGALDTSSKSVLANLAATGGNPFGNPGGLIDANKKIVSGTALPAIQEYQRLNANTGFGQSMNTAGGFAAGGIQADQGIYGSLGYGLGNLLNPPKTGMLEQILRLSGGTGL